MKRLMKSQQPADQLQRLIKKAIDQSIKYEPAVQTFLYWLLQKSKFTQASCRPAAIRAYYYNFDLGLGRNFDLDLDRDFGLYSILYSILYLDRDFDLYGNPYRDLDRDRALYLALHRNLDLALHRDPGLTMTRKLKKLRAESLVTS